MTTQTPATAPSNSIGNVARSIGASFGGRLSPLGRILLVGLVIWLAGAVAMAAWVDGQIQAGIYDRNARVSGLYVASFFEPHLQSLGATPAISGPDLAAIDNLLTGTALAGRTVTFKIWSPQGQIVYSPTAALVGQRFPVQGDLAQAVGGQVAQEVSNLQDAENVYERLRFASLLETYVPVHDRATGRVIGAAELYQLPDELTSEVSLTQLRSELGIGAAAVVSYLFVAILLVQVRRRFGREAWALRSELTRIARVKAQHDASQSRIARAALKALARRENEGRDVSARLHAGPGQHLAFALLRLDAIRARYPEAESGTPKGDIALIEHAMTNALAEIRSIAADMRTPSLAELSLAEVIDRAGREHERASGLRLEQRVENPPEILPLGIKVAIFRSVREGVGLLDGSAAAESIAVRAWTTKSWLHVTMTGLGRKRDQATSDDPETIERIRERIELLGGTCRFETRFGQAARLEVAVPLPAEVTRPLGLDVALVPAPEVSAQDAQAQA